MPGIWTITYDDGTGAVEKSASDWGLNAQPIIRTRDRSETVFSFRMAGADPAGSIPFAHYVARIKAGDTVAQAEAKSRVVIKQNRTFAAGAWSGSGYIFTGYLTTQHGRVDGNRQGIMLDFADTIWLMKNTTFQQLWKVNASDGMGGVTTSSVPISRCILFMDINTWTSFPWQTKSMQWQINEIITYAASCGIPIAAGTIDYSGFYINYYQVRAISCWDALLKCLEPSPDAKVWVDGSTTTPTLQVRTRANIAALTAPTTTAPGPITLPWRGTDSKGRKHFTSDLTPRYDLIPPQVVIQYQINNTLNGKSAPTWSNDVYPAGSTGQVPFGMVVPVDLTGASFTTVSGTLDCEALLVTAAQTGYSSGSTNDHAAKRAWWASKRGGEQSRLADFRVRFQDNAGAFVAIGDATVTDDNGSAINLSNYPNRLVNGTYHAWMKNGATQINVIRAHVRVSVQFVEYDVAGTTPAETDTNGNVVRRTKSHELHFQVTLTNSPAGVTTYNGLNATGTAESPATDMAQNVYNARKDLDYDGTHDVVDPGNASNIALSQIIGHWNVLNISGGNSEWATANMTIAGSEIDLMTNHQTLDIGPAKHLSPQDWNELLQFFRNRRVLLPSDLRATGYGDGSYSVDMARNTPDGNTAEGLAVDSARVLISPDSLDGTRSNFISLDAATGQMTLVQKPTAGGAAYTTGIIAPTYNGAGAPTSSTLATNAYYRVRDRYLDTSANAEYVCTTAGSNSTSVWAQISSSGGGTVFADFYDTTGGTAYTAGAVVQVLTAVTLSGITILPGTYVLRQGLTTPTGPTANQIPQYPYPATGTIYWMCISMGISTAAICSSGGSGSIYINSSGSF